MATVLPFDAAGIHLDPAQGLARQLYAALRERILDGRLGSRTRMPASRELAQALKVSRNTVVRAYEQLHAEGYIDGRTGDGTYVAELQEIPGRAPAVAPSAPRRAVRRPWRRHRKARRERSASACRPSTCSPSTPGRGYRRASGATRRRTAWATATRPARRACAS